jgi:glycosyltransferase involved in cell wall biosynthesis
MKAATDSISEAQRAGGLGQTASQAPSITFFIHTPKDLRTAVFGNVSRRAELLKEYGHAVNIFGPEDFPWVAKIAARWYTLIYPWAVAWYLFRLQTLPDIVIFHSHAGWAFHLIRPFSSRLKRVRTATQFHGLEPLFYKELQMETGKLSLRFRLMQGVIANSIIRMTCRRSDQVQCLNSEERDYLVNQRWASADRVVLYANAVDEEMFVKRDYHGAGNRLLFLGQWVERKGLRFLIDSFVDLHERNQEFELACIGTLTDADSVIREFPAGVHSALTIVPLVPHSEIKDYLAAAEIFVFPTLFEGFSIALVEAMASGLPIITTPVAAAVDLLQHGVNALFVPINDADELSEAILRLQADPALRARLGQNARAKAREYTWARVGEHFEGLIASIRPQGITVT